MDKDEIQQTAGKVEQLQGPKRRRGKWRFVLVAILVVAAIAAVFYFRGPGLNEQLRALAGESGQYQEEVRGPGWYVKLATKYKLPALKRPVVFGSDRVTDEDMEIVGRATTLRWVVLSSSEISDTGLVHLSELTELRRLYLIGAKVSDEGLVYLKNLKNLQILYLSGTQVTDAGLVHLKSLKSLTELQLSGTRVTSEGIANLKSALPKLIVYGK